MFYEQIIILEFFAGGLIIDVLIDYLNGSVENMYNLKSADAY